MVHSFACPNFSPESSLGGEITRNDHLQDLKSPCDPDWPRANYLYTDNSAHCSVAAVSRTTDTQSQSVYYDGFSSLQGNRATDELTTPKEKGKIKGRIHLDNF